MTVEEQVKAFCQNIIVLREKNDMSIEDMAEIMGISPNALESVEKGKLLDDVPFDVVFRIEKYFGIKAYKLFV